MNVALAKTETGRALSDAFAVARDRLPGAGKIAEARQQAFEAYERVGLPHRRIEDWKYTDLRVLDARGAAAGRRAGCRGAQARGRGLEAARDRQARGGWCWSTACSRRACPKPATSKRDLASARCARCSRPAMPRRRRQLLGPENPDSHDCAERGDDDRRRRDRGRRRDRANAAVADRPCRQWRGAFGDVHPLTAEARQGRPRHAGRKFYRRRRRESLSGQRCRHRLDRRQAPSWSMSG